MCRAGAVTILIDVENVYKLEELPEEQQPTFYVRSMHEVQQVLETQCRLEGSAPVMKESVHEEA